MWQKLPPLQRDCIIMYFWKGMRNGDIALMLGVTPPAVSKSISAALETIREHLEWFCGIYDRLERDLLEEQELL